MEGQLKNHEETGAPPLRPLADVTFDTDFDMDDGLVDFDSLDLETLAQFLTAPAPTAKPAVDAALVSETEELFGSALKPAVVPAVVPAFVPAVVPAAVPVVVPVVVPQFAAPTSTPSARGGGDGGDAPAVIVVPVATAALVAPVAAATALKGPQLEAKRERRRLAIEKWKAKRDRRNWKKVPMHKTRTAAAGSRERAHGRFVQSTRGFFSVTDFA